MDKDVLDLKLKTGDAMDRSRQKAQIMGMGATVINAVIKRSV